MALYQIAVIELIPMNHHIYLNAPAEQRESGSIQTFNKSYYGGRLHLDSASDEKTPLEDWEVSETVTELRAKAEGQVDKFDPENKPKFKAVYNKIIEVADDNEAEAKMNDMIRAYKDTERTE